MVSTRTRNLLIIVGIVALVAVVYEVCRRDDSTAAHGSAPSASVSEAPPLASATPTLTQPIEAGETRAPARDGGGALLSARWGSGRGELGRSRMQEGNAEGPMSLARAGEDLLVLDQVNGRVARYDGKGNIKSTFDASLTTQDIAVGKDGTVALLDRLVEKTVRLVDANGRAIATLPLPARITDPGLVTGVFVDGEDVYVEKEHGVLSLVGNTNGTVASEATDLTGRPSKDGSLLLMAVLAASEARVNLNAFDRKLGSLRFARAIQFPRPVHQVVLVDTDVRGTIYIGVAGGKPLAVNVACLTSTDGAVIGRLALPAQTTPDESFRDFTVADDGTITYSLRTEEGVDYVTARCP